MNTILYANTDDSTLLQLCKRSIFDRRQIYARESLRLRSHCSVFKFIRFIDIHFVPFLYKNGAKNIRFCAFTVLTKKDKNLSVFVIYDRAHCSLFMKLHKGAEALTLISALKLIADNSLIRKTGKT